RSTTTSSLGSGLMTDTILRKNSRQSPNRQAWLHCSGQLDPPTKHESPGTSGHRSLPELPATHLSFGPPGPPSSQIPSSSSSSSMQFFTPSPSVSSPSNA